MNFDFGKDIFYSRPLGITLLGLALLCAGLAGAYADGGAWLSVLTFGLLAVLWAWKAVKTLTPQSSQDSLDT